MLQITFIIIIIVILIVLYYYTTPFTSTVQDFTNEEEATIQRLIDDGTLNANPSDSQKIVALRLFHE